MLVGVCGGYFLAVFMIVVVSGLYGAIVQRDQRGPVFERLVADGFHPPTDCPFVGVGYSSDIVYVNGNSCWDFGALTYSPEGLCFHGTKTNFSLRPQDIVGAQIVSYPTDSGPWEQLFVDWRDESGRFGTVTIESQDAINATQATAHMEKWKFFIERLRSEPANEAEPVYPPRAEELPLVLTPKRPKPRLVSVLKYVALATLASIVVTALFLLTRQLSVFVVVLGFAGILYFGIGVKQWKEIDEDMDARGMKRM